MQDEVVELKANEISHSKKTTATLEVMARQIRDMKLAVGSCTTKVDSWEE